MGADKTNNIMTLSSGVSQPLLADVQYFELYSSSALNRKLKNIVLPGFYCGFEPVPGTGLSVRITSENSEGKGAASVDVNNVQISVQQIEDVTVSVKAGATNIIVLEANFEHGVKTTQVDSASSVSAARIYARTDNTIGQNQIELCRVIVPSGATAVTKEMIVLKYRVNRAVGVEFSNEISSTEERKAATPLAVKTLHDLVDTKAPLDSPHLSGTPTSPTPEPGTNNTQIANAAFVYAAINALINGAPGTMDTLKEIAAAINNDPNFSTTINNALALKAPLASPALTGIPTAPTAAQGTNNTQIATTAYVRAAISALVGSSPEALDTLNELAAALGNDPNFATTMTNALAGKQPLDATLTALAGLATGANKLPYFTGKDTVAQTDLTSVGRDILAKTSTLAVIQYLGLRELGTSGEKIPLLSTANTWSARQTFNGGITGALTGNADTATKLKTARTINGVGFDGSKNIELTAEDLNLEQTVELAAGALQKNQNGADIPGKDTFTKNIGACRAYSAWLNIGGDSQVWTTAQFISWLESQGAFNHPYWMCKGSWAYANNKVITDTGCGNICLAGAVVEVIGTRGAMTIRVTTPSTSSGGGITNAQFTYINHGDAYAPGWRRDYNTKNQQPAFALGQTGSRVANDKAVGWNWNSGVYDADISGASTLILHFNMNVGSCPAVQFRVNYKNGGIFYRSARDGYGFEANWSEFYTTTRKPSAGDVGAYTQAECNSRFITGIRLGGLSSVQTWNGPGWSDRSGYVVTGSVNGNRDELIDTTQARPIQYCINGTWYNAGSI
ncbi:phage tail protein [Escherichia coli]|nr:phage tail protein [Escherichia coli]HCN7981464.1 tail fiber protein [Escherichia coli]HCN9202648.1 tail fiber protein [Escherichia coli]